MVNLSPAVLEVAEAQQQLRSALRKREQGEKEIEAARARLRLARNAEQEEHYELMTQSA